MNPVFVLMVFAGGFILWLLCSFIFEPVGNIVTSIFDNLKEKFTIKENDETKGRE